MINLQTLFSLAKAEIQLTDISEFKNQPADILEILLDKSLLQIEQFQLTVEKNISAEEQIVWHINASLPQPIENYYYAYQIYLQNEEYLQGLFCVIEKAKLVSLTALQGQSVYIYSTDKQFLLYKNKLPFWQIENYLKRLFMLAKLASLIIFILAVVACPVLFWLQGQQAAQNSDLLQEKEILNARIKKARAAEQRQKAIQTNKVINKKISNYFYTFSLTLPEKVYFTNLSYLNREVKIEGFCAQDKDLKALQKTLKTEPSLKPELAKLQKTDRINFSLRIDLQKMLEKELKNDSK